MIDSTHLLLEAQRLLAAGQADQAAQLAESVLMSNPQAGMALTLLGHVSVRRGNGQLAMLLWETATRAAPTLPEPWVALGEALYHAGQIDKTVVAFREALNRGPELHDVRINLGLALQRLGRHEEAIGELRRALPHRPDNAEGSLTLATSLHELGRSHQAIDVLREAAQRHPTNVKIQSNLGVLHEKLDRLEDAIEFYARALALNPNDPQTLFNRGSSLIQLLRLNEARADWLAATRLDPNNATIKNNLAILELLDGNLKEGFELFESRWAVRHQKFPVPYPEWDGSALGDKHLLLYVEQGLGDVLQFCRYVPLIKKLHPRCRITIATLPTLHDLLRSLPGLDGVTNVAPPYPQAACTLSLLSVPRVLGTTLATIPADVPYLRADPALVAKWSARIKKDTPEGEPRIGLFWRGTQVDPNRTIKLAELAPLFSAAPHASFISLQKGEGEEELGTFPHKVLHIGHELLTYSDTAAALASIDLLITIDTSIAHAAGALARPTWTFLPFRPDWRWLTERQDCPWYPTMRLYRQTARKSWGEAIQKLAADLSRHSFE
jgi:Flp pilus assembly protein TadD